jgi:hypothetical protein
MLLRFMYFLSGILADLVVLLYTRDACWCRYIVALYTDVDQLKTRWICICIMCCVLGALYMHYVPRIFFENKACLRAFSKQPSMILFWWSNLSNGETYRQYCRELNESRYHFSARGKSLKQGYKAHVREVRRDECII